MGESKQLRRAVTQWRLRSRALELGRKTLVMGIVNITPDSFSDGGSFLDSQAAITHALGLLDEGADLLDLGAESTRPGARVAGEAAAVSSDEELARLLPVLSGILKSRPEAILSVDTYKAETARAALKAGAEIINDVSGFRWDPELAAGCAEAGCGVVLMHTRGRPDEWGTQPQLAPNALLETVRAGLEMCMKKAAAAGIAAESIVLDPGYGFGKLAVRDSAKRFGFNGCYWFLGRNGHCVSFLLVIARCSAPVADALPRARTRVPPADG